MGRETTTIFTGDSTEQSELNPESDGSCIFADRWGSINIFIPFRNLDLLERVLAAYSFRN